MPVEKTNNNDRTLFVADPESMVLEFDRAGRWQSALFRVDASQFNARIPGGNVAGREAVVYVCRGDSNGNINPIDLLAIDKHKPDAIFCCHPVEARRTNPTLPIQGWHSRQVILNLDKDAGVVMLSRDLDV